MRIDQWHSKKLASDAEYARAIAGVEETQRLADEIVARRVALGLTQKEVAELAGMTQPQISRLETAGANPTSATVAKLRAALAMHEAKVSALDLAEATVGGSRAKARVFISFSFQVPASYSYQWPAASFVREPVDYCEYAVSSRGEGLGTRAPEMVPVDDEGFSRAA